MYAPQPSDPNQDPNQQEPRPASEKQQEASRENGKKSQGPKTPEGKEKSKMNALKHGLTSKTTNPDQLLLSDEDPEAYKAFQQKYLEDMTPKTQDEVDLVDRISAASWRMARLLGIETEILDKGRYRKKEIFIRVGVNEKGVPIQMLERYEQEDMGLGYSFLKNIGTLERLHKYEKMLTSEFQRSQRLFYQNKLSKQKLAIEAKKEEKQENSKNEPKGLTRRDAVIPRSPSDAGIPQPETMQANQTKEIQNEPKPAAKPQGMPIWEPSPGHPDYRPFEKNEEIEEKSKTNPRKHYFTDLFQALTSGILPPPFPKMV